METDNANTMTNYYRVSDNGNIVLILSACIKSDSGKTLTVVREEGVVRRIKKTELLTSFDEAKALARTRIRKSIETLEKSVALQRENLDRLNNLSLNDLETSEYKAFCVDV